MGSPKPVKCKSNCAAPLDFLEGERRKILGVSMDCRLSEGLRINAMPTNRCAFANPSVPTPLKQSCKNKSMSITFSPSHLDRRFRLFLAQQPCRLIQRSWCCMEEHPWIKLLSSQRRYQAAASLIWPDNSTGSELCRLSCLFTPPFSHATLFSLQCSAPVYVGSIQVVENRSCCHVSASLTSLHRYRRHSARNLLDY